MKPQRFDTAELPVVEQFDAWLDWFNGVFDVDYAMPVDQGFRAASDVWTMPGCALSIVHAPKIRATRNRTLIRRNPLDPWCITVGRQTTTTIRSGDQVLRVPPTVPFVVSLGQELVSARDEDVRLQLYLSRDAFTDIAPALDASCGSVINGAFGPLLSDYLQLLVRRLPDIPETDLPRMRDAIAAMVSACVAPSADRLAEAADQIDLGRLERMRRTVRMHLRSPALGPRLLCRHLGMSRSQLYRLLEPDGGVARYIRRQRLLAAYAMLSDPNVDLTITQIAEELCFADGSAFSRAFRREFDISPTDLRAVSRNGQVRLPRTSDMAGTVPSNMFELLRRS